MRHRAGRHNWRAGMQRLPNADMPSCRQKRQTRRRATNYECSSAPSCRQKRQTRWYATNSDCVHHCMFPVLPDGNDARRKATREVTAISATLRPVAGNCFFDMASRRCGQKRHTAPTVATGKQQDSYGHEIANRDYHRYPTRLTGHFFAGASFLLNKRAVCLLQVLTTCFIGENDP